MGKKLTCSPVHSSSKMARESAVEHAGGGWFHDAYIHIMIPSSIHFPLIKAGKDRDTVSIEPGSRPFFGSVSVSESQFLCILCTKDTFCSLLKTLYVCRKSLDTVSVSESPTQILCIGNSLAYMIYLILLCVMLCLCGPPPVAVPAQHCGFRSCVLPNFEGTGWRGGIGGDQGAWMHHLPSLISTYPSCTNRFLQNWVAGTLLWGLHG